METGKMKLKTYNGMLHHAGNMLHQIPLLGVTEREVRLLGTLHGKENIEGITLIGEVEVDSTTNYFEMVDKYSSREDFGKRERMKQMVEKVFDVSLDQFDDWLSGQLEQAERAKLESTRVAEAAIESRIAEEVERRVETEVSRRIGVRPAPLPQAQPQEA